MCGTEKGRVRIPGDLQRAIGAWTGTEFELDSRGTVSVIEPALAAREISGMRGAGEGTMTTDEILALTRR